MQTALSAVLFTLLLVATPATAMTIYGEDFTGQDGWGVGNGGTLNTGNGETWTVSSSADGTGTDFSGIDNSDYFNVQSGVMEVRDADQIVYWIDEAAFSRRGWR